MPSALKHDNNHSRVAQASTPSLRRLLQSAGGSSRTHLSKYAAVSVSSCKTRLRDDVASSALPKHASPL